MDDEVIKKVWLSARKVSRHADALKEAADKFRCVVNSSTSTVEDKAAAWREILKASQKTTRDASTAFVAAMNAEQVLTDAAHADKGVSGKIKSSEKVENLLLQPDKLYRVEQICRRDADDTSYILPISQTRWLEGVKIGEYPPGQKISRRVAVWRGSEIKQVIDGTWKAATA